MFRLQPRMGLYAIKSFSTTHKAPRKRITTAKSHKKSAGRPPKTHNSSVRNKWIEQRNNDIYVRKAQQEGFLSRAAYKLLEMDDKIRNDGRLKGGLLHRGIRAVDLGCAPGGWAQVLVERVVDGDRGIVVGVDREAMGKDIVSFKFVHGDFNDDMVKRRIEKYLPNGQADLIVSDMAPSASGDKMNDHWRLIDIATSALSFACRHLSTNGNFLCKISRGGTEKAFVEEVKQHFDTVLLLKPEASRKTSPELYVYGYKYGGSG